MARKTPDMASVLDGLEARAAREHRRKASVITGAVAPATPAAAAAPARAPRPDAPAKPVRATSLVSMTAEEKGRFTRLARAHGLSLSAFFRLAAGEYVQTHEWDG